MLRTKSLRIRTGLEESTDKVPPLPIWEPPRTAPPRTSLVFGANGPPSSTTTEFGIARDAHLSAPVTATSRSTSPARGRSWTKTLNFLIPGRRKHDSGLAPNSDAIPPGRLSDVGPSSTTWSTGERVGSGSTLGLSTVSLLLNSSWSRIERRP